MTKPGTNRPLSVTNPKIHLGAAPSSSKPTRKPFHPPLPVYSPSRALQHHALRWSPPSQVPLVQDIYDDGHHIQQRIHTMRDNFNDGGYQIPQRVEKCVKQSTNEGDIQRNKKNLTWTSDMDAYLLDCLLDQIQKGQKIGGNFTKSANLAVAHIVSEKFSITCNHENVKHRMKTLKKNYFAAKEILSGQHGSGFGFNSSSCMIEANASTWDAYIKAHPSASIYRYKPVQHWEKMDSVYGQDRATGEYAFGPNERVRHWDNEENNVGDSSEQRGVDENSVDLEPEPTSSTSRPKNQKDSDKKRKRVVDLLVEELRSFREGIDKVAEAINPRNYTEKELFEHIQRINGMSLKNKMKVYKALTKDVSLARAFLGCCEEMHKLWMSTEFGDDIFDVI